MKHENVNLLYVQAVVFHAIPRRLHPCPRLAGQHESP